MMPTLRNLTFLAGLMASTAHVAAADRVALVIGNSAYRTQSVLANPANDAADIGAMFRRLGFEVVEGIDLDGAALKAKIKEFRDRLETGKLAVFYYSGHGMQIDGRNYIVPVDARIDKPEDVRLETVDLDLVLEVMRARDRVSVVVLDACRDSPFARSLRRAAKPATRAAESAYGGLAEVKSSVGSVIIYATDPGNVALDGDGRNSPFTESFLRNAPEPGVEISKVIKRVRLDVVRATGSKQVPWDSSTLVNDVYLAGEAPASAPVASAAPAAASAAAPITVAAHSPAEPLVRGEASPAATPSAQPSAPTSSPEPAAAPVEPKAADLCDRLASDPQDTLRNRAVPPVRAVDTARAVPACEKAVAEDPKSLRLANQLGRAYLKSERWTDALRVFKDAAGRGSPYATNEVGYLYYRGFGGVTKDYAQARPWFEKAAGLGVPVAMTNLAFMYAHGIGAELDPARALTWLRRGEAIGDPGAIVALGDHYLSGIGVEKDPAKARDLFQRAADMDDPEAMNQLGLLAQRGLGGPQDFDAARRWLEKAAAFDSPSGMYNLGYYYLMGTGGAPRDYAVARDWFARSIRHGGIDAMIGLAHMNLRGLGASVDRDKAKELLERAASHDNSHAMVYLARALRDGEFGVPDEAAARGWFEKAAALDDADARRELLELNNPLPAGKACDRLAAIATDPLRPKDVEPVDDIDTARAIPVCERAWKENPTTLRYADQLGLAYVTADRFDDAHRVFADAAKKKSAFAALWMGNIARRGLGRPVDQAAARKWWEQAAAQGSSDAMYNLAVILIETGEAPKARPWFEKAAALGDVAATRELAEVYYLGIGVAEDNTRARALYEVAAGKGDTRAKRRLGEIWREGHGVKADPTAARQWFQRAASDGDTDAMRLLADLYLNAKGGDREPKKARGLLEQAAEAGNARAMTALAQLLLAGTVGDVDEAGARRWYEAAAEKGDEGARNWLAAHAPAAAPDLSKGEACDRAAGSRADPLRSVEFPPVEQVDVKVAVPACEAAHAASPETLRWADQLARAYLAADRDLDAARVYRKAAEDGSAFAALWMGNLHARGLAGFAVDNARAAEWWLKAADLGSPNAMFNLGAIEFQAAASDPARAVKAGEWFERAAALGEPDSMFQLAVIHRDGLGVVTDRGRYLDWLRRAAEFGNGDAMRLLAVHLFKGEDGPRDEPGARRLLARAVEGGNLDAYADLASFLLEGRGGPKDLARARELLEAAAARQNVEALTSLARAHEKGTFGKPDKAQARRFYRLAADLGDTGAAEALTRLK